MQPAGASERNLLRFRPARSEFLLSSLQLLSIHPNFRRMRCVWKRECDQHALAHVADQRRAEACEAGAPRMADAGINDAPGSSIEQPGAQLLGGTLAVRVGIFLM